MSALKIKEAGVDAQGGVYRFIDASDGYPAAAVRPQVFAIAEDGRAFILPVFRPQTLEEARESEENCNQPVVLYHNAEKVAARVRAAGVIRPELWVELEPRPPLEEIFAQEAEREAYERFEHAGSFIGY